VTYRLYGSPWPPAMYAPELASIAPWSLAIAYRHGLGAIFSPADGWLPFAPVQWLGVAGLIALVVRFRRAGVAALACYIMIATPLVAVPLLLVLARSWAARLLFVPLVGLSLVLSGIGVLHHTLLYPDGSGTVVLPLANRLQEVWPDFGADARPVSPLTRPSFVLVPASAQRQTGRLVDGPAAQVTHAAPGTDAPGMLAYGPYRLLQPGTYLARFHLAASGERPLQQVATLDVMTDLPALFTVLAQRDVRLGDLPTGGGYATIDLPFTVREPARIETRIRYHGETEVWFGSIDVFQSAARESLERQFPSWPRTALWLAATVFVGCLLASAMRSADDNGETLQSGPAV
jgi:hypothetical protein